MPRIRKQTRMKGYGSGVQQILTGERSLQTINRRKQQKPPLQAPGNLALPLQAPIPRAPITVGQSGRGPNRGTHFGRYGDYLPPMIPTRYDL